MPYCSVKKPLLVFVSVFVLILCGFIPSRAEQNFDRRTPIVMAVEKVGPAVVNINTEEAVPAVRNPFRDFSGTPFDRFFQDFFPNLNSQRRSLGSGVIINSDGYVLTNEHVVARAVRIIVTLSDKREFSARLIGADIKSDLAIIKIDSKEPLPFAEMGRSHDLMIGETVLAIGNPFGLQHTVTTGIISALNRTISAGKNRVYRDFIQLDASINPGNSGGPLLNINGALIGINTAIYQKAEGIGFAIPIDSARRIVNELIRFGKVRRGWLGISAQDMTDDLLQFFGMEKRRGVLVTHVVKDGPADKAGLKNGDVILSLDGHRIDDKREYRERLTNYPIGSNIKFEILRDKRKRTVRVMVASIPKNYAVEFTRNWLGLEIKGMDRKLVRKYSLSTQSGVVVVDVVPGGAGGKIGIKPGDVIRQVNQNSINKEEDFSKAIIEAAGRESVVLLVQRGRYGYYVTLEP
ncbi:MAG: Do family serine endopeptidase [Nitrospinaceae bacterium]